MELISGGGFGGVGGTAMCMQRAQAFAKLPVRAFAIPAVQRGDVGLPGIAGLRDLSLAQTGIHEGANDVGPVHADIQAQMRLQVKRPCVRFDNHNCVMSTLKERLTEARTEAGLSQGRLAQLAKCGQTTIASIENGRNKGSTVLPRLADVLGVDPLWLAEGKGTKRRTATRGPRHYYVEHGTEDPDSTLQHASSIDRDKGQEGPTFALLTPAFVPHDPNPVTAEELMAGSIPDGRFAWESEDDLMAAGEIYAPRGWLVVIEPDAEPEPGDVVLIQIDSQRPVLRQLEFDGRGLQLVTTSGKINPIPLEDGSYQIFGVAITSYRKPKQVKRRGSLAASSVVRQRIRPRSYTGTSTGTQERDAHAESQKDERGGQS